MPNNVKNIKNGAILVEIEKDIETLLKMKKFHEIKIKVFPNKTLNTPRGVIRNRAVLLLHGRNKKTELKKK